MFVCVPFSRTCETWSELRAQHTNTSGGTNTGVHTARKEKTQKATGRAFSDNLAPESCLSLTVTPRLISQSLFFKFQFIFKFKLIRRETFVFAN